MVDGSRVKTSMCVVLMKVKLLSAYQQYLPIVSDIIDTHRKGIRYFTKRREVKIPLAHQSWHTRYLLISLIVNTMAAFLQPADPWIENTYIHAISFDASTSTAASATLDNEPSHENQSPTDSSSQQWDQTENTIPSGLLPSQPRSDHIPPSRKSKIVQIIHRGGEGWDGKRVKNGCPPYVILHDGQYSTVAFLSEVAQRSIGMNGQEEKSKSKKHPKQGSRRHSSRDITLKKKCLASVNQYTVSTVWGCVYPGELQCPQRVYRQQQQQQQARKHTEKVLGSLDIPQNLHAHLLPLRHLFLCLYITGTITVIGAENQGLIGETVDVHCSVGVRRELRVFNNCADDDYDGSVGYKRLMRRLEEVHNTYMDLEKNDTSIEEIKWPWISRLSSQQVDDDGGKNAEAGDVTYLLKCGDELEEVLGHETGGDDEQVDGNDNAIIGRASTGTYLAQWDIDNEESEEENDVVMRSGKPKAAAKTSDATNDNGIQVGDVQDLFSNYEYFQDVIALTQDQPPAKSMTQSNKQRDVLQSPGTVVPFIGIDQMIASQSQDSEEDSNQTLPLTQAEIFESALEELGDSEEQAENKSIEKEPGESQPISQDVSLTHSQSLNPEVYFSAAEEEGDANVESQIPIHVAKRAAKKKALQKKKRDKNLRYSQIPIESQISLIGRQDLKSSTLNECNGYDATNAAPNDLLQNSEMNDKPANGKTCQDCTIDEPTKKPKEGNADNTANSSQLESQMAGEGSEENSPQEVDATGEFDCDQDNNITGKADEQKEEVETEDHSKNGNNQVQKDLEAAPTSKSEQPVRPRRVIREFDMDRFLWRSKRLCRR